VNELINEVLNLPNILTLVRILLIFPFSFFILSGNYVQSGVILVFSALTDFFDGLIAKATNRCTKIGTIFDPVADKFTLLSVMICMGIKFSDVTPFILILVLKELCMLAAGFWLLRNKKIPLKARWYGKISTVFFYISVVIIVAMKAIWKIENQFVTYLFMGLTSLLMVHALIRYFLDFMRILKQKNI
jgi:cardiolipin synthase